MAVYLHGFLQVRLGRNGRGRGSRVGGVPVAGDKTLGVVISDFDKDTALLADVSRDAGGTS